MSRRKLRRKKKRFFDVAIRPVPLSAEPGVVIVEDDVDEELLVDDFDGQCCRTYPNNHSKILAWRRSKEEKLKSAAPPSVEKTKPTQISGAGVIKLFFRVAGEEQSKLECLRGAAVARWESERK